MENKFIKKRNRPSKPKHNKSDNFKVSYNQHKSTNYDYQNHDIDYTGAITNYDDQETSIDLLKVGKVWESTSIIEVKNTSGRIQFCDNAKIILSLVDDHICVLNMSDFKIIKEIRQVRT